VVGSLTFVFPVQAVPPAQLINAIKLALSWYFGVPYTSIVVTVTQARRLQQAPLLEASFRRLVDEWTAVYEVQVPSTQALSIKSTTHAIHGDTSDFGQQLEEQLVVVGADEDIVSSSFTMGTFEEATIMPITTTTETEVETEKSSTHMTVPLCWTNLVMVLLTVLASVMAQR